MGRELSCAWALTGQFDLQASYTESALFGLFGSYDTPDATSLLVDLRPFGNEWSVSVGPALIRRALSKVSVHGGYDDPPNERVRYRMLGVDLKLTMTRFLSETLALTLTPLGVAKPLTRLDRRQSDAYESLTPEAQRELDRFAVEDELSSVYRIVEIGIGLAF